MEEKVNNAKKQLEWVLMQIDRTRHTAVDKKTVNTALQMNTAMYTD